MTTAVKTRRAVTLERVRELPEAMRAAAIDAFGGPGALSIHSLPVPAPAADEEPFDVRAGLAREENGRESGPEGGGMSVARLTLSVKVVVAGRRGWRPGRLDPARASR